MYVASKTDYALLYSGEDQRVGGQIIQALKDRKIDYDRTEDGHFILDNETHDKCEFALRLMGFAADCGIGRQYLAELMSQMRVVAIASDATEDFIDICHKIGRFKHEREDRR